MPSGFDTLQIYIHRRISERAPDGSRAHTLPKPKRYPPGPQLRSIRCDIRKHTDGATPLHRISFRFESKPHWHQTGITQFIDFCSMTF